MMRELPLPRLGWWKGKEVMVLFTVREDGKPKTQRGRLVGYDSFFIYLETPHNTYAISLSSILLIKTPRDSTQQYAHAHEEEVIATPFLGG